MPLEDSNFISELNPAWPLGSDGVNTSDDHHRNTKKAVLASFPNINAEVTATPADLNTLTGAATLGSGLNPVGTVVQGLWATAPNGYLACDGVAIPIEYTALIALIGVNTPDLRGQFLRGWSADSLVDPDGPRAALTAQAEDFKAHTHDVSVADAPGGANQSPKGNANLVASNTTTSTGGDETRPINVAVLYAVKW